MIQKQKTAQQGFAEQRRAAAGLPPIAAPELEPAQVPAPEQAPAVQQAPKKTKAKKTKAKKPKAKR